ncbi:hypothetical protein B0T17DRAFT_149524 [Bombardia bombarda]|uniref:Rhodopsin domain-containing protein n=1 Tax=Bombardia bombarda TaxID=252184 RepID=A0AA39X6P2_9PEZI|nr:hypothetical protein B0T17DRAFT_149524 [Bombardia bombarda]
MVSYIDARTNLRGITNVAVIWLLVIFSAVFLGLRVYCKLARRRSLWWDDAFAIAAWIFLTTSVVFITICMMLGFGLHIHQIPKENFAPMGIMSNIVGFFSILGVALSKTSFAATLLRLTDGWTKRFVWFILITANTSHFFSALFIWVRCNPVAKAWDPLLPGTCWPFSVTVKYGIFVGAWATFCDFALALLPWRILMRFHMYRREKVGVAIAMSMGVIAGITSIIKCTTLHLFQSEDFTYDASLLVICGSVEVACTIMAASIPTLRSLFISTERPPRMPSLQFNISPPTTANLSHPWMESNERIDDRSDKSILGRQASSNRAAAPTDKSTSGHHIERHDSGAGALVYELKPVRNANG